MGQDVIKVYCGAQFSLALTKSGAVFSWYVLPNLLSLSQVSIEPCYEKTVFLHMRKQTQISFAVTAKLISAFVFAT